MHENAFSAQNRKFLQLFCPQYVIRITKTTRAIFHKIFIALTCKYVSKSILRTSPPKNISHYIRRFSKQFITKKTKQLLPKLLRLSPSLPTVIRVLRCARDIRSNHASCRCRNSRIRSHNSNIVNIRPILTGNVFQ